MKRVVVCMDGTWNAPEINNPKKNHPTNVLKLVRALEMHDGNVEQVVEYIPGVGTKQRLERWIGGATGWGLSWNIQRAYEFIVHNYDPRADQLYLFGFSRGAFAVRSLAGFIYKFSFLMKEHMPLFEQAWKQYQTDPQANLATLIERVGCDPTVTANLEQHPEGSIPILFLGVWDTVGALGAPTPLIKWLTRKYWDFHCVKLRSNVSYAYHALAIHEVRTHFTPSLWTTKAAKETKQVWFAGSHSDVGGGINKDSPLSDMTLDWMMAQAERQGLRFKRPPLTLEPQLTAEISHSWQHRPWWWLNPRPRGRDIAKTAVENAVHKSVESLQPRDRSLPWTRDLFGRERRALADADRLWPNLPVEQTVVAVPQNQVAPPSTQPTVIRTPGPITPLPPIKVLTRAARLKRELRDLEHIPSLQRSALLQAVLVFVEELSPQERTNAEAQSFVDVLVAHRAELTEDDRQRVDRLSISEGQATEDE